MNPKARVSNLFFNGLTFAALFLFVGLTLPPFVSKFIPESYYYHVVNPLSTDMTEYLPGQDVVIFLERDSRVAQAAEQTLELTLVSTDGSEQDVVTERRYINIEKGRRVIRVTIKIPDSAVPGAYEVHGNIHFRVEGVQRDAQFYTSRFSVASKSAQLQ